MHLLVYYLNKLKNSRCNDKGNKYNVRYVVTPEVYVQFIVLACYIAQYYVLVLAFPTYTSPTS